MADTKITDLTAQTSVDDNTDVLAGVDVSATTTKKFTFAIIKTWIEAFASYFNVTSDTLDDLTAGATKKHFTSSDESKLDAIEAAADVTDATNVNAAGATMNTDTTLVGNGYFLDEDNMASDSATKVPSQQSVKAYVDAQGGTKQFFVPVTTDEAIAFPYTDDLTNFVTASTGATAGVRFLFYIPDDFTTLSEAKIVVRPDATETVTYDLAANFAAAGEAYTTHSDSVADATQAVTINVLAELDASTTLTGVAAGDYVGLRFESDTNIIFVIGLMIKYT